MTDTEQQPSDYAQARAEAAALLGLDIGRLNPSDSLRLDLAVVLRRAIDVQTESAFDGQPIDLPRLMTAIERLTALLPELQHAHRPDPRAALLELLLTMRDREELGELAVERPAITPSESDIVPPGEQADRSFFRGAPTLGPDDHLAPPRPQVIEGKAPPAPAYDYNANQDWKAYVNSDGSIRSTPRGGRDWGPV
jgi:hypothetical protein